MTIDNTPPNNLPNLPPEKNNDGDCRNWLNHQVTFVNNVDLQIPKPQPGEIEKNKSIFKRKVTIIDPTKKRDSIDSAFDNVSLNSDIFSVASGVSVTSDESGYMSDFERNDTLESDQFKETRDKIPYVNEIEISIAEDTSSTAYFSQKTKKKPDSNTTLYYTLKTNLETISDNLDNIGFNTVKHLPRAIDVFSKKSSEKLIHSCEQLNLKDTGQGMVDNINELLVWCQTSPKIPAGDLIKHEKKYNNLQKKRDELFLKLSKKETPQVLKKYASIIDQIDTVKKNGGPLKNAQNEFDNAVHAQIKSQPAWHSFEKHAKTLRDALPQNIHANAPIAYQVEKWLTNILIERSKTKKPTK